MQKQLDKEDFATRWKTIQDLCSVIACHSAFEDCMDGDNGLGGHHVIVYLSSLTIVKENIWPLIVQSTWFVNFLEELMRECVLLGDSREGLGDEVTGVCWFVIPLITPEPPPIGKQTTPSIHPTLLNLLSPDALAKLSVTVGYVKQLYGQLKSVDPNGENGAIARNALLDTVDSSGINLEGLESLLTQISEKIDGSNGRWDSCSLIQLESSMLCSSRRAAKYRCLQSHARGLPSIVGNSADGVQIRCHRKIKAVY